MARQKRGYETLIVNGRVEKNLVLEFREHCWRNKVSLQQLMTKWVTEYMAEVKAASKGAK